MSTQRFARERERMVDEQLVGRGVTDARVIEAMRRRIRDIAASRDLSDDEIKPVLRLKHREIGEFCRKHDVSLQWLLEGAGPIFKKYPIMLSEPTAPIDQEA